MFLKWSFEKTIKIITFIFYIDRCIPEFILENIWHYLTLVRRFHPRSLEESGSSLVNELLNAILIFMTSNSRVRNPHLRARLAECLYSLLPHTDEDSSVNNLLGSYYREMLFLNHPHRKQVKQICYNI